ncbi:MAG: TolC family protein, partial [Proteobacteria bacterium]|nr:TolC family protein [Pseudomonadota bacterium]
MAFAASALAMALLAGCGSTPPYHPPALNLPAQYKEAAQAADQGLWRPAQPGDAAATAQWWTLFGDPHLNRLQQQAAAGNPGIAQAVARLRAAQAALAGSRAARLPTLGASAGATRARSGGGGSAASGPITSTSDQLGLNASWELDLWGRLSGAVDASSAAAQASGADLAAARLSLQAQLVQAYFALRTAEAQYKRIQAPLRGAVLGPGQGCQPGQ